MSQKEKVSSKKKKDVYEKIRLVKQEDKKDNQSIELILKIQNDILNYIKNNVSNNN